MSKIVELTTTAIYINGKELTENYIVSYYNGVSDNGPCITFSEFIKRYNLEEIQEVIVDRELYASEIVKQILSTSIRIDAITINKWSNVSENDRALLAKMFADRDYLFETTYGTFYASREHLEQSNQKVVPSVTLTNSVIPTDKKRYKIECEITAIGDIFSLLYNTFSEVSNLKVTPIFDAVPIKIVNGECKTPDYTLFVYPDGISLVFDPISRENGNKYVLQKPTDDDIINWLETMDSEQVYKMAQLTFTKMQ